MVSRGFARLAAGGHGGNGAGCDFIRHVAGSDAQQRCGFEGKMAIVTGAGAVWVAHTP